MVHVAIKVTQVVTAQNTTSGTSHIDVLIHRTMDDCHPSTIIVSSHTCIDPHLPHVRFVQVYCQRVVAYHRNMENISSI